MRRGQGPRSMLFCGMATGAILAAFAPTAHAQTVTATYALDNVWLLPNETHPWEIAQPMSGTFQWIYTEGDFENGAGEFLDLALPWYDPGLSGLKITFDVTSIECSLVGNYHDLGVDLTLFLLPPLAPGGTAMVDTTRSAFEIQQGISRRGTMVSGSVIPVAAPCPADIGGDANVGIDDFLAVLAAWGGCVDCPEDVTGDDVVGINDFLSVLANWGPCG